MPSGSIFQTLRLPHPETARLEPARCEGYTHYQRPTNGGGLVLGQIAMVARFRSAKGNG